MRERKILKYYLAVLLTLMAVLVVPFHTEAAKNPNKKTVKKLYKEYLEQYASGSDSFITLDINRDGVKELIISKPRQNSYSNDIFSIYTIKSKKVTYIGQIQESSAYEYNVTGKQKAVYYNKKYKSIRNSETGPYSSTLTLYQLSGRKLKERFQSTAIYNRYRYFSIKKGKSKEKTVSLSTLNSFEKKYMRKQCKKVKLVLNTEKNRKNYL